MRLVILFVALLAYLNLASCAAQKSAIELTEDNWENMLTNEWLVEFYAPWCPACKNLAPVWDDFSTWADDLSIKVAKVDVTSSPGLSGRFFVTALPTIFHVMNGEFRQYRGSRDLNSFMVFIEEKKWEEIEPVSSWKKPDSIPMSILSLFFKLSHFLKVMKFKLNELNNTLLKEYGLPVWGSYALFAVATIVLGAVVGLLLVCVIDFIWPQKNIQRQSFSEVKQQDKNSDEEIIGDELEGDESETSDGEKFSNSEGEEAESDSKKSPKGTPKGSPDVRKRKTRKAD